MICMSQMLVDIIRRLFVDQSSASNQDSNWLMLPLTTRSIVSPRLSYSLDDHWITRTCNNNGCAKSCPSSTALIPGSSKASILVQRMMHSSASHSKPRSCMKDIWDIWGDWTRLFYRRATRLRESGALHCAVHTPRILGVGTRKVLVRGWSDLWRNDRVREFWMRESKCRPPVHGRWRIGCWMCFRSLGFGSCCTPYFLTLEASVRASDIGVGVVVIVISYRDVIALRSRTL